MAEQWMISHETEAKDFDRLVESIRARIIGKGDDQAGSVTEKLQCLAELAKGALGRFLLETRGCSGYWASVCFGSRDENSLLQLEPIERFFIEQSPLGIARNEHAATVQREAQKLIADGCVFASLPSGFMRETLELDYSRVADFKLVACDLDPQALNGAVELGKSLGLEGHLELRHMSAWELRAKQEFSLVVNVGFSGYVADDAKLLELYRKIYEALKSGGTLITDCINPPPTVDPNSEWNLSQVNAEHLRKQTVLFDVFQPLWQNFRSTEKVCQLLMLAGFSQITIKFDRAKIVPVLWGRNSNEVPWASISYRTLHKRELLEKFLSD